MDDKLYYSRQESAYLLSVSIRTIDHKVASKELRAKRIGRRILIPRTELERFIRNDHSGRPTTGAQTTQPAE
jgi:excisionase family DNA binding protein